LIQELQSCDREPSRHHFENHAETVAYDVELAIGIESERADVAERRRTAEFGRVLADVEGARRNAHRVDRNSQRPHAALDEIGVEVPAPMGESQGEPPIHVAADDRLTQGAVVLVNWIDQRRIRRRRRGDVGMRRLPVAPPVVAASKIRRLVIDFLPAALTDVPDDKRARSSAGRIVDDVAREAREVDEESSADGGIRGEGHPQQPLLASERGRARQIQQVRGEHHTALHDADAPGLLDDVLNPAVRGILDESDGH
jgi:hypothetical protein